MAIFKSQVRGGKKFGQDMTEAEAQARSIAKFGDVQKAELGQVVHGLNASSHTAKLNGFSTRTANGKEIYILDCGAAGEFISNFEPPIGAEEVKLNRCAVGDYITTNGGANCRECLVATVQFVDFVSVKRIGDLQHGLAKAQLDAATKSLAAQNANA
jgi:hypothetical protein